jgi:hypothetical protein
MPSRRTTLIASAARLIGWFIVAQGVLGLALPDRFVALVRVFQDPPVIYAAAAIRFAFGALLFAAAPASRAPLALRVLGAAIAVGGLVTPFVGAAFAEWVFAWWVDGGAAVVRAWAGVGLGIGAFIVHATAGRRAPGAP